MAVSTIASDYARNPAVAGTNQSYVEWGAVWAGGAMASALSFVFLTFGGALGLSFIAPYSGTATTIGWVASLAVFWTMAQQIGSSMIGGYIAGRMRARWGDTTEHEVEFRDGLHGGLVWGVGTILLAAMLISTASVVARTGASVASAAPSIATAASDSFGYAIDSLIRPNGIAAPNANNAPLPPDVRAELTRAMGSAIVHGSLPDQDRSFIAGVVVQRTGLSEADAEKRVTDIYNQAAQTAKDAAAQLKRSSILFGFVTAASLLAGLGAAWWGAQRGGHHRDNSIPARFSLN